MNWPVKLLLPLLALGCAKAGSGKPHKDEPGATGPGAPLPAAQVPGQEAALRYLSFSLRDLPPTGDEAQAVAQGKQSIDALVQAWQGTPEHLLRIKRYFGDMVGVSPTTTTLPTLSTLTKDVHGIYQMADARAGRPACDPAVAVSTAAWWLDAGQTIMTCPFIVSTTLQPTGASGKTLRCATSTKDFLDPACGCGPEMIACHPADAAADIRHAIRMEIAERGAYYYAHGGSWADFLGGTELIANRYLLWWYVMTTSVLPASMDPDAAELAALHALPTTAFVPAAFPKSTAGNAPDGLIRSGIVTAPGFLSQYNTFRARIHGLVLGLLCKDVDPTLGNDVSTYANPGFTAFDKSHGVKSGCSGCHYPMDNMASLDFGWTQTANYDARKGAVLTGHAFGADGAGPAFLAQSFVDRAAEFKECMAKTAWQSFSGQAWDDLPKDAQARLVAAVPAGPKSTVAAVFAEPAFRAARVGASVAGSGSSGLNFTKDIAPIITVTCGGGACHGAGTPNAPFTDDEAAFRGLADTVATRIADGGGMPPASSGRVLAPADRDRILKFLGK